MNIIPEVNPGISLGGVFIGSNSLKTIELLSPCHKVESKPGLIVVNEGLLSISYDSDSAIDSIMCNTALQCKYKKLLWPGMTVRDLLKNTTTQVAIGGCVIVDGIDGIGLPLPSDADDFESITDFLPLDHVFEHLSVFRIN